MDTTVQLLKALAEPTRLRIVALCRAGGDLTVSEFVRILGQSQPRVSRHLKLLTEAGALNRIPEGSWVFYRINASPIVEGIVNAAIDGIPQDDTVASRDRERLNLVKQERAAAADSYFSANAEAWGEIRALHVDQDQVNAALLAAIPAHGVGSLLDIGTGTGEMLTLFADRIGHGEGVDLSREMLSVARHNLDQGGHAHCHVRQGDLYSLPFTDDAFDAVIVHQVLHFVDDITGAVAEAARVLKPGGVLLIADFAPHDVEDLRASHQHRRLGFADIDFDNAFADAAITTATVAHLTGDPLTVTIWSGKKTAKQNEQEAAA